MLYSIRSGLEDTGFGVLIIPGLIYGDGNERDTSWGYGVVGKADVGGKEGEWGH